MGCFLSCVFLCGDGSNDYFPGMIDEHGAQVCFLTFAAACCWPPYTARCLCQVNQLCLCPEMNVRKYAVLFIKIYLSQSLASPGRAVP